MILKLSKESKDNRFFILVFCFVLYVSLLNDMSLYKPAEAMNPFVCGSGPCYVLYVLRKTNTGIEPQPHVVDFLSSAGLGNLSSHMQATDKEKAEIQKLKQHHVSYQHLFIVIKTSEYKVHSQVQREVTELLCLIPTANQC